MIGAYLNKHLGETQRRRWFDLLLTTADDVGLANDPEFRSAFVGYLEWGSRLAVINSQAGIEAPEFRPCRNGAGARQADPIFRPESYLVAGETGRSEAGAGISKGALQMKTITSAAVAAMMLGLAACNPATAPTKGAEAASAPGTVTLVEKPKLSADVEALPRLAGDSPSIVRINAELDRLDAAAKADAAECATMGAEAGRGGGWSRIITRPMTGPAYLTLREHLEVYCGGAYPSNTQSAITYDLSTGARADWVSLLPGLSLVQDESTEGMPADYVYTIRSPQLEALYERKMFADAEDAEWRDQCKDVWKPQPDAEMGQGFYVWADAMHGGVAIDADYVHAVQACGGTVYLTADEMRAAGAPQTLINALAAAQTAGNWAPKEDAEAAE